MAIPVPVLVVVGLIVSARARLSAVVFGQPVSVSILGLIAAVLILVLTIAALLLARSVARELRKPKRRWTYSS